MKLESEEIYRDLLVHAGIGVNIWNTDGVLLFLNDISEQHLGGRAEDLIGRDICEIMGDVSGNMYFERIRRAAASNSQTEYEDFISLPSGDAWYLLVFSRVTAPDGTVLGVQVLSHDITKRKQAEQALADEAVMRKILIEQSRDGIVTLDQDGKVYEANQKFADMLRYSSDEVRQLHVWDWDTQIERGQLLEMIRTIDEAGDHFETRHLRKDGSIYDVEISTNAGVFGRKKLIFCVCRDITERNQAEKALRESEERFKQVTENAGEFIWEVDANGLYTYCNAASENVLGYLPSELVGRKYFYDLFAPDVREEFKELALGMFRKKERFHNFFNSNIHKNGSIVFLETSGSPILDNKGNLLGYRGADMNITERKRAENALRQANRQLNLLSNITRHDILNNVTILIGYLSFVKEKFTDPELGEYLERLESATKAIQHEIEFTRVYQDLGCQEPQWQDLDRLIGRQNVPSNIALHADMQRVRVFADMMLEKVFFNLLDNSVKHGEKVTEIRVSCTKSGENLMIVWEDNGVGIAPDEKERIFERGYGKHSGLGLFLTREILWITGLTITETGEPGKGARFEIHIPSGMYQI